MGYDPATPDPRHLEFPLAEVTEPERPWGVERLYWFHAFSRPTVEATLAVLRDGAAPPPEGVAEDTHQLELALDVQGRRVYAYLGRTTEAFGKGVLVVPSALALVTKVEISPFDTGGLVRHIPPVADWSQTLQREFLRSYTWPGSDLPALFALYPGGTLGAVARYLDPNARPVHPGPQSVWPDRLGGDIWVETGAIWPCWTWEARWATPVSCEDLVAWSCAAVDYPAIVERLEEDDDDTLLRRVLRTYVPGGASSCVAQFAIRQATS